MFATDQADPTLRQLAGLALKNSLTAKVSRPYIAWYVSVAVLKNCMQDTTRKEEYAQRWLSIDQGVRSQVKQDVSVEMCDFTLDTICTDVMM